MLMFLSVAPTCFATSLDGAQWVLIITAIGTQTAIIVGMFLNRREVGKIHTMVNSQNDANVARKDQLEQALQDSDTPIPPVPKKGE